MFSFQVYFRLNSVHSLDLTEKYVITIYIELSTVWGPKYLPKSF